MTLADEGLGVTISTWGWLNADGQPSQPGQSQYRLWSARSKGERVFLAMPITTSDTQVLLAAARLFGHFVIEEGE